MHSANAETPFTDWKPPSAVNREKEAERQREREREQELLEKKEAFEAAAERKARTDGERDVNWLDGIIGLFEAHGEALSDLASLSGDPKLYVNSFACMHSSMLCPIF